MIVSLPKSEQGSQHGIHDSQNLINLLEFEIDQIRKNTSQPGWTTWALIGSLATMVWLLSLEFEKSAISTSNFLFVFILFSLVYDSAQELVRLLDQWDLGSYRAARFFIASKTISLFREGILVKLIRSICLLFALIHFGITSNSYFLVLAEIFYGFQAILYFMGLSLSFTGFIFPLSARSALNSRIISILLLILGLTSLLGLVAGIWGGTIFPSMAEYRAGGLFASSLVLLLYLTNRRIGNPLISNLVEVRRGLAFGYLDFESAKRQTEIALLGMTVADVFQNDIVELLNKLQIFTGKIDLSERELRSLLSLLGIQAVEKIDDQNSIIKAVYASLSRHIAEASRDFQAYRELYLKFRKRVVLFTRLAPEVVSEILQLEESLDQALAASESKLDEFKKKTEDFEKSSPYRLEDIARFE